VNRNFRVLLGILVTVFTLAFGVAYTANYRAYRRATELLGDTRATTLGVTTDDEIVKIVHRYGDNSEDQSSQACQVLEPGWKSYSVQVESKTLNWIGESDLKRGTILRPFGAPVWRANVSMASKDGRLACIVYSLVSEHVQPETIYTSATYSLPLLPNGKEDSYYVSFRDLHGGKTLAAISNVSEDHSKIFDIRLNCLRNWGGCGAVCQVMPSAWAAYKIQANQAGQALPGDEVNNPGCRDNPESSAIDPAAADAQAVPRLSASSRAEQGASRLPVGFERSATRRLSRLVSQIDDKDKRLLVGLAQKMAAR
jgi:hypothetical protein